MTSTINGKTAGHPLTDNNYVHDGYRFHDAVHLTHAAALNWSPITNWLCAVPNYWPQMSISTEEAVASAIFAAHTHRRRGENWARIFAQGEAPALAAKTLETPAHTDAWDRAARASMQALRALAENKGGRITAYPRNGIITYRVPEHPRKRRS